MLLAETAMLLERKLLLHLLLVPLRVGRDAPTFGTFQLRHVFLDLSHIRVKKITLPTVRKNPLSVNTRRSLQIDLSR